MTAILLERACATQLTAQAAGELRHWTGQRDSLEKAPVCWPDSQLRAGWRYWVRRAGAVSDPT